MRRFLFIMVLLAILFVQAGGIKFMCKENNMTKLTAEEEKVTVLAENISRAYFAGGCFWGVEYYMEQIPGVLEVTSGYMGGHLENPTYEDVCKGNTGHVETVEVLYNKNVTDYEELAKEFFEIHDPTQKDRQGPDIGNQYRSVVYYADEKEKITALRLIEQLKSNGYDAVTELIPVNTFYCAEDYHQNYYRKTGKTPYCHSKTKRF